MNKLSAWDLDGTIRPGSLLGDAVLHGVAEGFIDPAKFVDPSRPTYAEVDHFVDALRQRPNRVFKELIDKVSDEARTQAYSWAIEELDRQLTDSVAIILSHSPDFLVSAFARGLKIERAHGSEFRVARSRFTGEATTLDKTKALAVYFEQMRQDRLAFAAGDSEADIPLLEVADRAVVVNPTEGLAHIALTHGWEIVRTDEYGL